MCELIVKSIFENRNIAMYILLVLILLIQVKCVEFQVKQEKNTNKHGIYKRLDNYYIFCFNGVRIYKYQDGKIVKHWELKKEANNILKYIQKSPNFVIINHVKSDHTVTYIFFLNFSKEFQIISTKYKEFSSNFSYIKQNEKWTIIYSGNFIFYKNSTEFTKIDDFNYIDIYYITTYAYNVDYFYVRSKDKLYSYNTITQKRHLMGKKLIYINQDNMFNVKIVDTNNKKYIQTKPELIEPIIFQNSEISHILHSSATTVKNIKTIHNRIVIFLKVYLNF
ncbi:hypothetical protein A3Q56_08352 [Intoshia linei]|uniref:Olfactomedin-like domain-containing protein n=1 Tax=Intoshia linei TaxID=1819745 RepID=A0A177ARC3_9BILA|nr:hypothetical protein A3Q56_08352 [Intoshia linei]